jgi:hypothetical protein
LAKTDGAVAAIITRSGFAVDYDRAHGLRSFANARGLLQLPPAQEDDAKKKYAEQETAAVNAVRRGWKHLLLPQEVQPDSPNAVRGFDLETVVLSNRANDPDPLAQLRFHQLDEWILRRLWSHRAKR